MDIDFKALFDILPTPFLVVDMDLAIVYANQAYLRTTQRTLEDLRGRYVFDAFPESGERLQRFKDAFSRARDGEDNVVAFAPYSLPKPESEGGGFEMHYWSCTHTPVRDAAGRPQFVVQHALEISELRRLGDSANAPNRQPRYQLVGDVLKRANEVQRLNRVLANERNRFRILADAVARLPSARHEDELMEIVRVTAKDLFAADGTLLIYQGTKQRQFVEGVGPQWLADPHSASFLATLHDSATATNETLVIGDVRNSDAISTQLKAGFASTVVLIPGHLAQAASSIAFYWTDGRSFAPVEVLVLELLARAASTALEGLYLLTSLRDELYERQRAESALRDADRRKDEFLATLSHELRNPLAPLQNALEILRLKNEDSATADRLHDMMRRQVAHMIRLVDDLLELSRVSRNTIELRKRSVDLRSIIADALETSEPNIESAGCTVHVTHAPTPLLLYVDPVRLVQVVSNLLNNAAKYSVGESPIWVDARLEDGCAVISVRDQGLGIEASMLPHIFDMFVQINSRSSDGVGVGLTLVRSLVEKHGGSVEAKSEGLGKGSEFIVRLPLADASDATSNETPIPCE